MDSELPPNFSMKNTYGALLIGTLIATFASGMNALQAILYFRVYPEDSRKVKILVAAVLCLDITHSGLLWVNLWFFLIEHFGNPFEIDVIGKPIMVPSAILLGSVTAFIVHLFYIHRIFNLSHRNYWISVPIFILILSYMGGVIAAIDILYKYRTLSQLSASGDAWIMSLSFSIDAAVDIATMGSLFVLLRLSRQHSISLNNVIDQLILYTLEMGSLTAFMAIAIVISWFTQRQAFVYLAIFLPLSKAYVATFLGSLNTRYHLRHSRNSQNGQASWNMVRVENTPYQSEHTDFSSMPPQIPKSTESSVDV